MTMVKKMGTSVFRFYNRRGKLRYPEILVIFNMAKVKMFAALLVVMILVQMFADSDAWRRRRRRRRNGKKIEDAVDVDAANIDTNQLSDHERDMIIDLLKDDMNDPGDKPDGYQEDE
ncbi:uncharacterized protein LOC106152583 [Lingula anatina]|uniref:Uncharacterized protein LOC106152583 n=1 Tax=Lingula anatina TaxID=7574 RepID=A0A1S3H6P1_LINAN|nr:uncharacterized protein LOC106152583 [Lingula anatina]|eukprot:XP_013381668.1 uncharacterized protein LOC106152583 [Lingula anatina]